MPSFEAVMRAGHGRQRQASGGAAITLLCGCGEYVALFECATRISKVLGDRELENLGDGLSESVPRYKIRFGEMSDALGKLTEAGLSVALVDQVPEGFVLIWRINPISKAPVEEEQELTLDDL
jgi:hypothetical protein